MVQVGYKKHYLDVFCIFLLWLAGLFLFGKTIGTGAALYGSDFVLQFCAWKGFAYDHLWSHGSLPFWNPYLFSGSPFITNIQASMFYPFGFFYYLLPPEQAYGYSTMMHCMLGSVLMYLFMRGISISPGGSFFSAIVFAYNGYFLGHLYAGHLTFVQAYVWIPLVFYLLRRFVLTLAWRYALAGGLVLGNQMLGGFPQISFYTLLSCLLLLCFYGARFLKERAFASAAKAGIGFALAVATGFTLAAVQILPTLEFTSLSTRAGGVSYAMATYDSLHPKDLMTFLLPDLYGSPVDSTYWVSVESWHFWEACGYVGIIPLFLVFMRPRHGEMRSIRFFFILLVAVALFLALGKHNPIYPLVYRLPGFHSFRIPAQILFLYVFGMAALAGMGLHHLGEEGARFNRGAPVFFVAIGALLCLFALALHLYPFHFFFQLFRAFSEGSVAHADLSALSHRVNLSVDKGVLLFFASSLLFLLAKRRPGSPRAYVIPLVACVLMADLFLFGSQFVKTFEFRTPPEKVMALQQFPKSSVQGRVVTTGEPFRANDGLMYGFPSVLGYDPLILKRYVQYVFSSQGYVPHDHVVNIESLADPESKLLKLLYVKKAFVNGEVQELNNPIPYAVFVGKSVLKNEEEVLSFMKSENFDLHQVVVLESQREKGEPFSHPEKPLSGSCEVLQYSFETITLKASVNQPAYLVLSEIYYPGWHATVDGEKAEVLQGNYLFRVIPLAQGEHEVCLRFVSWPFRIGGVISIVTLVGALWLLQRRRGDTQAGKGLRVV